jgi:hypothetical protein
VLSTTDIMFCICTEIKQLSLNEQALDKSYNSSRFHSTSCFYLGIKQHLRYE